MAQHASACPLDCPDTCSLTIDVEDERVVRIAGNDRNPITNSLICGKVRKFTRHMYGPERVLYPMARDGAKGAGAFRRISWDEALDRICQQFQRIRSERGGEAILPYNYGGSNGYLTDGTLDTRLFRRLGASKLLHTFCAVPTAKAYQGLYGKMPGVAIEDFVHAQLIVLWGVNPSATGIHTIPYIDEARRRGARLVVVDPRAIPLAKRADLHLAPRPGADLPLALSIIHWMFENGVADLDFLDAHTTGWQTLRERAAAWTIDRAADVTGIDANDIRSLARFFGDATPAVVRCGWGIERNRNGGNATAAVLALPAIANKFGVRGGGFTMSSGAGWGLDLEPVIAEPEPDTRAVNMLHLGRALCDFDDPPVDALFVYNCNPLATAPRQHEVRRGLEREDLFTVVFDQVFTDTAAYADIVLPATTFLEHRELRKSYGAPFMFDSPPVVAPVAEARPNYEVFAELCRRLGLSRPGDITEPSALVSGIVDSSPARTDIGASLVESGMATRPGGAAPVAFRDTWPHTDDRKVHLVPETLERESPGGMYAYRPDPGTSKYPLALISPALANLVSSSFGQLLTGRVSVDVHPDDARARAIEPGDEVRVFNDIGEFRSTARITRAVRPGVIHMPKGLWRQHTLSGSTANAVIPDDLADFGGGACYNDARVQIERV